MTIFIRMTKILLILFSIQLSIAMAQEPDLIIRKTMDFHIDGTGSSGEWEKVEWVDIPQRTNSSVQYETKAKVLYSDTGMYFLVECQEKKLTASLMGYMKDLWDEDVVEVFLWTDEKYPIYFEYEISPLNQELVLIVPNFDGDFLGWIPWHYDQEARQIKHMTSVKGGKKEPGAAIDSWTSEFFIPFALLEPLKNVPPEPGMEWRMNIYRMDYDTGMRVTWEWKPTDKTFHEFEKFGRIVFE